MKKAYVDNNIVSAIAKGEFPTESDSLDRLLTAWDEGKVDLVTSEVTLREIKRWVGERRTEAERIFQRLGKVPIVRWDELRGMHSYGDKYTWINSPQIENDPLYDSLLKLRLDKPRKVEDAQHVFVATKQKCDVFVTLDTRVLARANDIQRLCGLVVQKPSEFVASEGW
jgi:predicted nucleic acid-binding protein